MPNHVTTKITIEQNHQAVFEFIKTEESNFDFNTLIPMPESLDINSGSETSAAFVYALTDGYKNDYSAPFKHRVYFGSVFNPFSSWDSELNWSKEFFSRLITEEQQTSFIELGKKVVSNFNQYGVGTWYEWGPKNWGTKWNAYEVKVNNNYIEFDTAWNAPMPVLNALVEKFNLTCDIRAFDEGGNFWFIQKYVGGKLMEDRQSLPEDEDSLALELKGYTPEEEE